jgi:hypothetical protein
VVKVLMGDKNSLRADGAFLQPLRHTVGCVYHE